MSCVVLHARCVVYVYMCVYVVCSKRISGVRVLKCYFSTYDDLMCTAREGHRQSTPISGFIRVRTAYTDDAQQHDFIVIPKPTNIYIRCLLYDVVIIFNLLTRRSLCFSDIYCKQTAADYKPTRWRSRKSP